MAEQLLDSQSETKLEPSKGQLKHFVLLFASIAALYMLFASIWWYELGGSPGSSYFIYLADGWLHGELYLHNVPSNTAD